MILDEIAEKTRQRYAEIKKNIPLEEIKAKALAMNADTGYPFKKAMLNEGLSFICEVKKASPSKGIIAEEFDYMAIAKDYEAAGASAISVLTEPYYFKGSDAYLKEIAQEVKIPVLRKDFTVDEYQIYEAKTLGASCVLLICALLDTETIKSYLSIAHSLGMNAIVETHSAEEAESALLSGADIIGINNRNLKTFNVDLNTTKEISKLIPKDKILISESGIKTKDDILFVKENGASAVLIGETFMRSDNKKELFKELNS